MSVSLSINGNQIQAENGKTLLEAADENGIYIPRLCFHPSLGSSHGLKPVETIFREDGEFKNDGSGFEDGFPGCRLCLVEIEGREGLFTSCDTVIEDGMKVDSESEKVKEVRRKNLTEILREHPHACLLCAQQEGCSRTQCSTNVPESERCCPLLGHCELQKVSQYIGVAEDIIKYVPKNLPKHESEPLFNRDYNLCVSCLRCVRACRDLRGIETLGFVYEDGKVLVGPTKSSVYADSDCMFCGACVEVCPTGAITDKDLPSGEKHEVLVPCIANCPAGIDIPRYIWLIGEGKYDEALAVVMETIPFPGILGRICFHPCEDVCRRGQLNEPMAICALKWFAYENGDTPTLKPKAPTGKKVAIIGSGPAGLSAGYFLAKAGHTVKVFEAEEEIGGMLRYAIPDYRLTPTALEEDLMVLKDLGVEFRTNTPVGKDFPFSELKNDFDAVFIGTGAFQSKKIPLEGLDLEGVLWGLDFLKDVKKSKTDAIQGRVVVIGGGNVAMDVARTALRLGATEVQLACLECNEELPAHDWEIEEAKEEGVVMHPSWGPNKILGDNNVSGIELKRCTSVFDEKGNFAPKFDDCETMTIETDNVILAIGQVSDTFFLDGVEVDRGIINVDEDMQTSKPGVYAGGEVSRGPASVVEAVADGAKAAASIDRYLGGDGNIYEGIETEEMSPKISPIEDFGSVPRVKIEKAPPLERKKNFEPVEKCYDESKAKEEARRCLKCNLRLLILPITLPPERWLELTQENVAQVPAEEGVYQLLNENKEIIVIKGTQDMHADLEAKLSSETKAKFFGFEPEPMYSKRESELIQQFLQQFGKMPEGDGGEEDLDDLF